MIRWIVANQLGTGPFDRIPPDDYTVLDVRELVDKAGNSTDAVRAKIDEGLAVIKSGSALVVACDFGISRSNAIAAGILASWRAIDFDDALQLVLAETGETSIKLAMLESVRQALGASNKTTVRTGILLTGGTGFLGGHTMAALKALGLEVIAPTRAELDLIGSATDIAAFAEKHHIGQIAHLAHPRHYTDNPAMGDSMLMLRNLIDVAISREIPLLRVSCAGVFGGYGGAERNAPTDLPMRPSGLDGQTKLLEETLINAAEAEGLHAAVARLSPVYGPGGDRPRFIRKFREAVRAKQKITTHVYENGPAQMELLYVDDAAAGLAEIIERRLTGCFHLGTGQTVTPADVAHIIAKLMGTRAEVDQMPITGETSRIRLGSASSGELLDWSPKVELDEGLRRVLELG
jgi:UDP-glucuronate decarboxylase